MKTFDKKDEFTCVNSDKTTHTFSITCTNSQIESYLEALNFVIGLATVICPKDDLHLVSLAEELENILNKGLLRSIGDE